MSKDSSAKHYQKNKESVQNRHVKNIEIFLKKKKKKINNMVVNDISLIMKNNDLLIIGKKL